MAERVLTNRDIKSITSDQKESNNTRKWDGIDRRKAIGSCVEPYHDRRSK